MNYLGRQALRLLTALVAGTVVSGVLPVVTAHATTAAVFAAGQIVRIDVPAAD